MKSDKPYISFVAASRNDNHGGTLLKRMKIFVNGLLHQCKKHQLPAELLIVEWNPPKGKLLNEVLSRPTKEDWLTIRYIIVPAEIHAKYQSSKVLPLHQMIAKNVGIRRAKGDFVLCTNIDLLFPDELFTFFAKRKLKADCFYRTFRVDVRSDMETTWSFEKQITYSKKNILQVQSNPRLLGTRPYLFYLPKSIVQWFNKKWTAFAFDQLETYACGDFTLMSKEAWEKIEGYLELDLYPVHIDTLGLIIASAMGYKQVLFPRKACAFHLDHGGGWTTMPTKDMIRFYQKVPCLGWDVVYRIAMEKLKDEQPYGINERNWGFKGTSFKELVFSPKAMVQK